MLESELESWVAVVLGDDDGCEDEDELLCVDVAGGCCVSDVDCATTGTASAAAKGNANSIETFIDDIPPE
jgi:hypothetical protein